ncbi:uracil-DNA glycosylase [Tsuneonella aeria]|uniref:uracil-DNA glycosylase n=1 Tax=Tsuneonella aeria TaxID=1837929 RepID=UPI0019254CCA|nr:uracil-DNA glycosylase [Tsuneonella aeria]
MLTLPDQPRAMRDPAVREARLAALNEPHIAPLTDLVHAFRARDDSEYPFFDPADGGVGASILFLLEKPGPMTVPKGKGLWQGSGFISRDNDEPTAEASFRFYREAGVDRRQSVVWNVIPGWNGTIRVTPAELRAGVEDLASVLGLLPQLQTIVLVGRRAAPGEPPIRGLGDYAVFHSAHPSGQVRAGNPRLWAEIPLIWKAAWEATLTSIKHAKILTCPRADQPA